MVFQIILRHCLEEVGLLDIEPFKLSPTGRNKWASIDRIAKRIDCFLITESFIYEANRFRRWLTNRGDFDHSPVLLEIAPEE